MGAGGVTEDVNVHFDVTGDPAAKAGVISQQFSALGDIISKATGAATSFAAIVAAGVGGMALHGLIGLNDQFEQTQIVIGGFLNTLGVAGTYAQGFDLAANVMERIRIDAAALPGEAEDYIEVFKAGLPVVQKAVGGTITEMTAFTNRYTAIAKTLQVDSAQAARDLQLMLGDTGRAGGHVKTFQQLLPFLHKVEGQANLTAASFNKMTAPERAKILTDAMGKLAPMLEKSAHSFDAMKGAIISNGKALLRLSSEPLFEFAKEQLSQLNSMLFDTNGKMTPLAERIVGVGRNISEHVVSGMAAAIEGVKALSHAWDKLASSQAFNTVAQLASSLLDSAGAAGAGLGKLFGGPDSATKMFSGPLEEAVGAVAMVLSAVSPLGTLFGAMLGRLATHTEAVASMFNSASDTIESAVVILGIWLDSITRGGAIMGDLAAQVLPGFFGLISQTADALIPFAQAVDAVHQQYVARIMPIVQNLVDQFNRLVSATGPLIESIVQLASDAELLDVVFGTLYEGLEETAMQLTVFVSALSSVIERINALVGKVAGVKTDNAPMQDPGNYTIYPGAPSNGVAPRAVSTLDKAHAQGGATGAHGGGGRAVNDFRFSQFDITQKFAEGFDPDRIAVAFSEDLGRIGEMRRQSGFDPLFAVR